MDAHQDLGRTRFAGDIGGPPTAPALTLSHRGVGGAYIMRGNPISWIVNPLQCIPFLHLAGQPSAASSEVQGALPDTAGAGVLQYGDQGPVGGPSSPNPNPTQTGTPDISAMNKMLTGYTPPGGTKSRQQQYIESNPDVGPFNPQNSGSQNFLQIRRARQAEQPVVIQSRQQGVPSISQAGQPLNTPDARNPRLARRGR